MTNLAKIEHAIRCMEVLEINYKGSIRLIEPHLIGVTTAGNVALSAFQLSAESGSGFRVFLLDNIAFIETTGDTFEQTRPGYNSNDPTMSQIILAL